MRLLDAKDHRDEWLEMLGRLPEPCRDLYFHPDYLRMHAEDLAKAAMFVHESGGEIWCHPFVMKPVPVSLSNERLFDIESAYGYGGPLSSSSAPEFLEGAHAAFDDWVHGEPMVAEFVRFHPLLENWRWISPKAEVVPDRHTYSLDLGVLSDPALPFEGKTRNMIRRAERLGVTVEKVDLDAEYDRFVDFYLSAMKRMNAAEELLFSSEYFRQLNLLLEENGFLLVAFKDGEWAAASLFFHGESLLHYHLSASSEERVQGATNLVLLEAGRLGHEMGLARLHLGGGLSSDPKDPLARFKGRMSSDTHEFRIGKRIHKPEMYRELAGTWSQSHPDLVERYGRRLLKYHAVPEGSR